MLYQRPINKEWLEFLGEVKQIFPNATMESIQIGKTLRDINFCWCYGEVR